MHNRSLYQVIALTLAFLASLPGCSTFQFAMARQETQKLLREGRPVEAAQQIEQKAFADGDDQVVYLFEYGTAMQMAKEYKKSNAALLKADELTDIKDYHSISRIGGSLLFNQSMVQYKGEDYEKVFLNAVLAVNFLMLGDQEAAQVEMRKLNDKLYKYKFEAKRDYEQDPFAFYLSALIWEGSHSWDDAYIDFKKTYERNPGLPYLREDLIRAAYNSRRFDELEKWQREFPAVKLNKKNNSLGEIVLVFQQGWAPRKQPHPESLRIPKLYPVPSWTNSARLVVSGVGEEPTQTVTSVERVAIKTLDDAYAGLVATRVAGVATKAVVSDQLRQKNELLGNLAWIGLNLADQADLRQWSTLPATFQVAKIKVQPGTYTVHAEGLGADGPTGERSDEMTVQVKAGRKAFVAWRSVK